MHEEAAHLRDEIKRMKKMDLEFAQDMMSSLAPAAIET